VRDDEAMMRESAPRSCVLAAAAILRACGQDRASSGAAHAYVFAILLFQ
jgi:hypothetical protein